MWADRASSVTGALDIDRNLSNLCRTFCQRFVVFGYFYVLFDVFRFFFGVFRYFLLVLMHFDARFRQKTPLPFRSMALDLQQTFVAWIVPRHPCQASPVVHTPAAAPVCNFSMEKEGYFLQLRICLFREYGNDQMTPQCISQAFCLLLTIYGTFQVFSLSSSDFGVATLPMKKRSHGSTNPGDWHTSKSACFVS